MRRIWICIALLLSGCGFSEQMDIMFECRSPSGQLLATLYRITTGDRPGDQEVYVNIRPVNSSLNTAMHSFSFRHGYDAIIHWDSEHQVRMVFPGGSEITHQERVVFGTSQTFNAADSIHIDYQEKTSTHGYFMVEKRCFNASKSSK